MQPRWVRSTIPSWTRCGAFMRGAFRRAMRSNPPPATHRMAVWRSVRARGAGLVMCWSHGLSLGRRLLNFAAHDERPCLDGDASGATLLSSGSMVGPGQALNGFSRAPRDQQRAPPELGRPWMARRWRAMRSEAVAVAYLGGSLPLCWPPKDGDEGARSLSAAPTRAWRQMPSAHTLRSWGCSLHIYIYVGCCVGGPADMHRCGPRRSTADVDKMLGCPRRRRVWLRRRPSSTWRRHCASAPRQMRSLGGVAKQHAWLA